MTPKNNCPTCGASGDYRGLQKGIDKRNGRWYVYPYFNCSNPQCDTGFGDLSEKRYLDDGTLVPCEQGETA